MALTKNDLNNIKAVVKDAVVEGVEDLARMIQHDVVAHMATKEDIVRLEARLDDDDGRFTAVERRLDRIDSHVADVAANQRQLVSTLAGKRVLTPEETRALTADQQSAR